MAHRRIASALDRLGQFTQSRGHYKKAQSFAPKDARIWNDAGYSEYLQGRLAEAERSLRTAVKLAPDDARVRTNLGMTLAAAGKTEEALPYLSSNQGDAIGHMNLGYLLAATGQYQRARQEYQAALSMRQDLALARRALVQLDRQERGIAAQPPVSVAQTTVKVPTSRTRDPEVTRTSAPRAIEISPPRASASNVSKIPPPRTPTSHIDKIPPPRTFPSRAGAIPLPRADITRRRDAAAMDVCAAGRRDPAAATDSFAPAQAAEWRTSLISGSEESDRGHESV